VNLTLQIVNLRMLSMKDQGFMFSELPALISFWHLQTYTRGHKKTKDMPTSYFLRLTTLIWHYKTTVSAQINDPGGRNKETFMVFSSAAK
jgi:hypothetical protein